MILVKINDDNVLYECIYVAFGGDKKLIEQYHLVGKNLDECVNDTYNKILQTSQEIVLEKYAVIDEEVVLGYLVVSITHKFLYSFGLAINKRQYFSDLFFSEISKLLSHNFKCILWTKNSRAIEYLKRNGMRIEEQTEEITTLCP